MDNQQLLELITRLQQQVNDLTAQVNLNNFSTSQDFQKYSRFNTRLKLPTLAALPAVCEQGEKCVLSTTGKEYTCSAANTWTITGTQS